MIVAHHTRHGYTENLKAMFDDVYKDLIAAGFTPIFKNAVKFTVQSGYPVDPLFDSQPWRVHFDSAYMLEFLKTIYLDNTKSTSEIVKEYGRIVLGTSHQLLNNGTVLPLPTPKPFDGPMTYTLLTPPSHGQLTGVLPNYVYTPDPGFIGLDFFTWKASKGSLDSRIATVHLEVVPPPAPIVVDATLTTNYLTDIVSKLSGAGHKNSALAFMLLSSPSHGLLDTSNLPNFTYTPEVPWVGTTSFTYKATDSAGSSSNIGTITLNVVAPTPPVCLDITLSTKANIPITSIFKTQRPVTNGVFSLEIDPLYGIMEINGNSFTYTPNLDSIQNEIFTYKCVLGGIIESNVATIRITVSKPNPPVVLNGSQQETTKKNVAKSFVVAAAAERSDLAFAVTQVPYSGQVTGVFPHLTYTPNTNFSGPDVFLYKGYDNFQQGSNPCLVSINVEAPIPPVIPNIPQTIGVTRGQAVNFVASAATTNLALSYSVNSQPRYGAISGDFPNLTYTSFILPSFSGADTFTYRGYDGVEYSNSVLITINIANVYLGMVMEQGTNTPAAGVTVNQSKKTPSGPLTYGAGDLGVSVTGADGSFQLVDPGSTNGYVNSVCVQLTRGASTTRSIYIYATVIRNHSDLWLAI